MIAYASRTGTRRNLGAMKEHGWRLMVSARGALRTEGFRYALDNGAWTSHQRGEPFDGDAFMRAVYALGEDADFIVIPDIVAGGLQSLEFSMAWLKKLQSLMIGRFFLLPVQDGMGECDIAPLVGPSLGIFVGGSTEWKESSLYLWGEVARRRGAWLHVGRVNSERRIHLCAAAGADSFDGSSATRFSCTTNRLDRARRQPDLLARRRLHCCSLPGPKHLRNNSHDATNNPTTKRLDDLT